MGELRKSMTEIIFSLIARLASNLLEISNVEMRPLSILIRIV